MNNMWINIRHSEEIAPQTNRQAVLIKGAFDFHNFIIHFNQVYVNPQYI